MKDRLRTILNVLALPLFLASSNLESKAEFADNDMPVLEVGVKTQNYNHLADYITSAESHYAEKAAAKIPKFRENLAKYGGATLITQKDNFVKYQTGAHKDVLDLAYRNRKENLSDKEILVTAKGMAQKFGARNKWVNYKSQGVMQSLFKRVKNEAGFFFGLLNNKSNFNSFGELLQSTYTLQETRDYVNKQKAESIEYYDSMHNTVLFGFAPNGIFDELGKIERDVIDELLTEYKLMANK